MPELDLKSLNEHLEVTPPREILRWAWGTFAPDIGVSSSFQTQSVPLLHMIAQETPEMQVLFLDTGFHFQETLAFRDRLVKMLNLRLITLKPRTGHEGFKRRHGELFRYNPDLCCYINKVEPMELKKKHLRAWVTGIRRDQTGTRSKTPVVSVLSGGLYKVCPMVRWTRRDVWSYIARHQLPEHPLLAQGYLSVGCAPCTRALLDGEDERSGRWSETEKSECGIHLDLSQLTRLNDDR